VLGLPAAGDTTGERFRLAAALLGERQRLPSAKSLGRDAFDMAVTREQDFAAAWKRRGGRRCL